ncbi:MAG: shikimate kinase [Epibacterium sp.]|nr:shikimate kinase [Epibacterium sp.]NQX73431.1 shikimate kinase [Epibacterium sp.]
MSEKDLDTGALAESRAQAASPEADLGPGGNHPGTLKKTVVMVGMMGAGKTAVGRALAARLGVPFLDSDHEIETAANLTIPEIFARDGEAFFREKEHQVISRLLNEECGILSTGGGAFLAERNREAISEAGVAVCLKADLEVLWKRVKGRNTRPLLQTDAPYQTLAEIYAARAQIYDLAEIKVPSDGETTIEVMVDRVLDALTSRPDVLEKT